MFPKVINIILNIISRSESDDPKNKSDDGSEFFHFSFLT